MIVGEKRKVSSENDENQLDAKKSKSVSSLLDSPSNPDLSHKPTIFLKEKEEPPKDKSNLIEKSNSELIELLKDKEIQILKLENQVKLALLERMTSTKQLDSFKLRLIEEKAKTDREVKNLEGQLAQLEEELVKAKTEMENLTKNSNDLSASELAKVQQEIEILTKNFKNERERANRNALLFTSYEFSLEEAKNEQISLSDELTKAKAEIGILTNKMEALARAKSSEIQLENYGQELIKSKEKIDCLKKQLEEALSVSKSSQIQLEKTKKKLEESKVERELEIILSEDYENELIILTKNLEDEKSRFEEERNSLLLDSNSMRNKLNETEKKLLLAEVKFQTTIEEAAAGKRRNKEMIESLKKENGNLSNKLATFAELNCSTTDLMKVKEETIEILSKEKEEFQSENDKLYQRLKQFEIEADQSREQGEMAQYLKAEKIRMEASIERLEKELDEAKQKCLGEEQIQEAKEIISNLEGKLAGLKEEAEILSNDKKKLNQLNNELTVKANTKITSLESELSKLKKERNNTFSIAPWIDEEEDDEIQIIGGLSPVEALTKQKEKLHLQLSNLRAESIQLKKDLLEANERKSASEKALIDHLSKEENKLKQLDDQLKISNATILKIKQEHSQIIQILKESKAELSRRLKSQSNVDEDCIIIEEISPKMRTLEAEISNLSAKNVDLISQLKELEKDRNYAINRVQEQAIKIEKLESENEKNSAVKEATIKSLEEEIFSLRVSQSKLESRLQESGLSNLDFQNEVHLLYEEKRKEKEKFERFLEEMANQKKMNEDFKKLKDLQLEKADDELSRLMAKLVDTETQKNVYLTRAESSEARSQKAEDQLKSAEQELEFQKVKIEELIKEMGMAFAKVEENKRSLQREKQKADQILEDLSQEMRTKDVENLKKSEGKLQKKEEINQQLKEMNTKLVESEEQRIFHQNRAEEIERKVIDLETHNSFMQICQNIHYDQLRNFDVEAVLLNILSQVISKENEEAKKALSIVKQAEAKTKQKLVDKEATIKQLQLELEMAKKTLNPAIKPINSEASSTHRLIGPPSYRNSGNLVFSSRPVTSFICPHAVPPPIAVPSRQPANFQQTPMANGSRPVASRPRDVPRQFVFHPVALPMNQPVSQSRVFQAPSRSAFRHLNNPPPSNGNMPLPQGVKYTNYFKPK